MRVNAQQLASVQGGWSITRDGFPTVVYRGIYRLYKRAHTNVQTGSCALTGYRDLYIYIYIFRAQHYHRCSLAFSSTIPRFLIPFWGEGIFFGFFFCFSFLTVHIEEGSFYTRKIRAAATAAAARVRSFQREEGMLLPRWTLLSVRPRRFSPAPLPSLPRPVEHPCRQHP